MTSVAQAHIEYQDRPLDDFIVTSFTPFNVGTIFHTFSSTTPPGSLDLTLETPCTIFVHLMRLL